jgi:hypothetical protein
MLDKTKDDLTFDALVCLHSLRLKRKNILPLFLRTKNKLYDSISHFYTFLSVKTWLLFKLNWRFIDAFFF